MKTRPSNTVFMSCVRLFTAPLVALAKDKANAKHAGVGVGFAREASKENREAVNIFEKKWTY